MMRRIAWLLLLTAPLARADEPPVACQPSADCALQMVRETALRNFAVPRGQATLELSLKALAWAGKFDAPGDAELRARFATLEQQAAALPAHYLPSMHGDLAVAMAANGFVDEARELGARLTSQKSRDRLNQALACTYARRGNIREAVQSLAAIDDDFIEYDAFDEMSDCVAHTANPELARAMAGQLPASTISDRRAAIMIARTEQAAGHHDAAREAAQSIEDDGWRRNALAELTASYRRNANYPEAAKTARLLRDVVARLDEPWSDRTVLQGLVEDLINSNAHPEVVALLGEVPAEYLDYAFASVLKKSPDPGVIREIATKLPQLPGEEQAKLQSALLAAQVRVGDLKAADALGRARDPQELAGEFIALARSLGAEQQALAREVLQAAIAAKGRRPAEFWKDVVWAQASVGLLKEAHRNIDRNIRDAGLRGYVLVGVSGAEAQHGNAVEAARSRAQGRRLLARERSSEDDFSLAIYLNDAGYPEEAQACLVAAIRRGQSNFTYDYLPQQLVTTLARRGDFARALGLANAASAHFDGTPEPFADVYSAATGASSLVIRNYIR